MLEILVWCVIGIMVGRSIYKVYRHDHISGLIHGIGYLLNDIMEYSTVSRNGMVHISYNDRPHIRIDEADSKRVTIYNDQIVSVVLNDKIDTYDYERELKLMLELLTFEYEIRSGVIGNEI